MLLILSGFLEWLIAKEPGMTNNDLICYICSPRHMLHLNYGLPKIYTLVGLDVLLSISTLIEGAAVLSDLEDFSIEAEC